MPKSKNNPAPSTTVRAAKRTKAATTAPVPAARATRAPAPAALPPAATAVQTLLSAESGVSTAALAQKAGLSRPTASKALAALESADAARREVGGRDGARRAPDLWFALARPGEAPSVKTGAQDDDEPASSDPAQSAEVLPQPAQAQQAQNAPGDKATEQPASGAHVRDGAPEADGDAQQPESGDPAAEAAAPAGRRDRQGRAPAASAPQSGGSERRLPKGALRAMVADHLAGNPELEITASKLGKILERSSGAVANALDKLAETGEVEQVAATPRTFRHRAPHPAR